jgi:hypothetical protein
VAKFLTIFFIAVVAVVAIGLTLRPGTVLGISDVALAASIARTADASEPGGCHHRANTWFCTDGDSRMYRATVGDYGCWEAVTVTPDGTVSSLHPVEGCVSLPDVLGLR